jgi:hypothetical protein
MELLQLAKTRLSSFIHIMAAALVAKPDEAGVLSVFPREDRFVLKTRREHARLPEWDATQ